MDKHKFVLDIVCRQVIKIEFYSKGTRKLSHIHTFTQIFVFRTLCVASTTFFDAFILRKVSLKSRVVVRCIEKEKKWTVI